MASLSPRALWFLGIRALFIHPWRRLLQRRSSALGRFVRQYGPEGLIGLPAATGARQAEFMRCTGCGLCDQVCPLVGKLEGGAFRGPSVVALAYSRSTTELPVVASTLRALPEACGSCRACVDICPTRVPVLDLFTHARALLDRVEDARGRS